MSAASGRLPRLLALVPWLLAHPDRPVGEIAAEFGVSEKQLRADLDLIFVCGLPGYTPGDLMEVEYVGDRVTLRNADTLARPLRLSADEGWALIVALRTLQDLPGLGDAVARTLAKLETAVGDAAGEAARVGIVVLNERDVLETMGQAIADGRRLHLRYYVPGRDETTERDVDPVRVAWAGGRPYLEGYCRLAEDMRLFRLDRVHEVSMLDAPAEVPADATLRDLDTELFRAAPDDPVVELRVAASARWVADYYPCESTAEEPDGGLRIRLRTADEGWVIRLALRLGGSAEVVAPPELAAQVRSAAAEALRMYS